MGRIPEAYFDNRARCFACSGIGELKIDSKGKPYRPKKFNKELRDRVRDRVAAQAWVHAELEKIRKSMVRAGELTFEALTEYYLQHQEKAVSAERYQRVVEHLDRFGGWSPVEGSARMDLRPVREITKSVVEGYRNALLGQELSLAYISRGLLCTLKACFRWASDVDPGTYPGLPLPKYPLQGLTVPKVPKRKPRRVDALEVSRFLRWAWRRALKLGRGPNGIHARSSVVLLMCLRDTGARPKELCAAEWSDFKVYGDGWGLIRLEPWKWKNGDDKAEDRLVAIPPHCVRRILEIRDRPGRHETRIFTHRRGRGKADVGTAEAGQPWVMLDHAKKRKGDTKLFQQWFYRLRLEGADAGYKLCKGFRLYYNRSAYTTAARRKGVNDVLLAKSLGTSVKMLDDGYTDLEELDVLSVSKAAATPLPPPSPRMDLPPGRIPRTAGDAA